MGYETPTSIQAQAIPVALSGFDMIGLAKTGMLVLLCISFFLIRLVLGD